jgi:hypothetical protein
VNHSLEPVAIEIEQRAQGLFITRGSAPKTLGNLAKLVGLCVLHTLIKCDPRSIVSVDWHFSSTFFDSTAMDQKVVQIQSQNAAARPSGL